MKKSLLSILAVVAMAIVVVACGNGKIVDAQVKALEACTAKLDSVETMEQFQKVSEELTNATAEFAKTAGEVKFSEAEAAKITEASTAYATKAQAVAQKLAEKAAAAAAAEAAKAAEEAAAAEKK